MTIFYIASIIGKIKMQTIYLLLCAVHVYLSTTCSRSRKFIERMENNKTIKEAP